MNRIRLASCLVLWFGIAVGVRAQASTLSASLRIEAAATQPANAPVLLDLIVTNTGSVPLRFWSSGPGEYPDASDFTATVARAAPPGAAILIELSNGQRSDGSGRTYEVAPGKSIRFPATLGPLDPGEYELTVCGAATSINGGNAPVTWPAARSIGPAHLIVRADDELLAERDHRILAGVRANDPFARYIAVNWPRPAVRAALAADLEGDDVIAAERAANGLWGDRDPAPADLPIVADAILHHLQPPESGSDIGLLTRLTRMADARKPAELADAIDRLLESRTDGPIPRLAERWTRWMPAVDPSTRRPGGEPGGKTFPVNEPIPQIQVMAVRIGTGIDLSNDPDPAERRLGIKFLAEYARDPKAAAAIRARLNDPDPECRRLARAAAERIPFPATQP